MISKIHLSPNELELFCNAEIILTKNNVIQKTIRLLDEVQQMMLKEKTSDEIFSVSPKISKGENYLGLPYVILDYPRKADGDNIFFIRSMFWWGNFFSSTLHISGRFKEQHQGELKIAFEKLSNENYFIGINEDPWVHHFEVNNYRKISELSDEEFENFLDLHHQIKIAAQWPLIKWSEAATLLFDSWKFLLDLIS